MRAAVILMVSVVASHPPSRERKRQTAGGHTPWNAAHSRILLSRVAKLPTRTRPTDRERSAVLQRRANLYYHCWLGVSRDQQCVISSPVIELVAKEIIHGRLGEPVDRRYRELFAVTRVFRIIQFMRRAHCAHGSRQRRDCKKEECAGCA